MLKLLPAAAVCVMLLASDKGPWADKPIANWTEEDAKALLNSSPWTKNVQPTWERSSENGQSPRMGRRGGMGGGRMGGGGIGIGLPGGMGGRGAGYPGGQTGGGRRGSNDSTTVQPVQLRWESALPVRAAELKARDTTAPILEDEDHYAIAVYGVTSHVLSGDPENLSKQLKKAATLKREGKPEIKPSSVDVVEHPEGPVVVYLFPRTQEISAKDQRVDFDAKIGPLHLTQPFYIDEMTIQGKLEL